VAWLFARSGGSRFVVRMEDLDLRTSSPVHEESQLADLAALGLDWDGAVIHQSGRFDRYRAAIGQLEQSGLTYPCYCTRREIREAAAAPHGLAPDGAYPGTCRRLSTRERRAHEAAGRRAAIRLDAGAAAVTFTDRIHGIVTGPVDDVVLCRNDGVPAYNLAVVVDDAAQGIGDVVRADDLLLSTPRQIHLGRLLGLPIPSYAHIPLVLGPDGDRLAKRHGAVTLADLAARGCDVRHVRARLAASLGLAAPDEVPSLSTLLSRFDVARLPRQAWQITGV
jgi:glutamyl-tRNA synthetase